MKKLKTFINNLKRRYYQNRMDTLVDATEIATVNGDTREVERCLKSYDKYQAKLNRCS